MHTMLVGCCWGQTWCTCAHSRPSHACCSSALHPMSISHAQSWAPSQALIYPAAAAPASEPHCFSGWVCRPERPPPQQPVSVLQRLALSQGLLVVMQGLSTELGAFIAGVMLSSTDQQELCLHNLESIKHFFLTLFISSMGLVMSPVFLLQHLPVLAGGVLMCVICKSILVRHSGQVSPVQRDHGMAWHGYQLGPPGSSGM